MVNYFFDTYAIIELLKHNPAYKTYEDYPLITTILHKIELSWWGLLKYNQEFANILLQSIVHTQEITNDVIRDAILFRQQFKKRDLSYADAIGYAFARRHDLLFLTGDRQFKNLPGVEYVE